MRFMMMHKMTDEMEKGLPPDEESMAGIGALMEDAGKAGVILGGEGLKPSAERVHVAYANGVRTVTNGPFAHPKELIGGFLVLRVRSRDEALAWVDRFARVLGDVELYVGPIVEPWDLGFAPKPDDAPLRFLAMPQGEARADDAPKSPARAAELDALVEEMTKAGVLEASAHLAGTKRGARIRLEGDRHTLIDGPFAESKELIAGYAIFELPSKEAAIPWALRFGKLVKVNELEIREVL